MKAQTVVIALMAALIAAPSTAHAQDLVDFLLTPPGKLVVTTQHPAYPAKVIAPRDYLEQIRRGTLREVELEVPPGPLNDAFARAHRGSRRLNSLSMRVNQGVGEPFKIEMKRVYITSYSIHATASEGGDKYGRVKVQFHWDGTSPTTVPIPVYQIEATSSGSATPAPLIGKAIGNASGDANDDAAAAAAPWSASAVILPSMDQGPLYDGGRGPPRTATITLPDLIPVNNGLQLGSKVIPWGQTAMISTDEASSKQGGRCEFRYRYGTTNAGQAGAGPAANLILLNALNGPVLANAPLPALAVAAQHTSSGTLQLVPGTWTLYVHVDGQTQVVETDDKNNVQRVRVQVDGKCD